jgi:ABC-type dipeptide/oligopeptide/nickel transport system permease component
MLRLVLTRLAYAVLVMIGVTFVVASLIKLIPGDPVDIMAAGNPGMTVEDMDKLRHELGLTRPILEQFFIYAKNAVLGDLGISIRQRVPAAGLIWERLPATAELAFWAILIALAVAIPIGIVTALKRDTAIDYAGTVVAVLGVSVPGFLLGILLILVLSVNLRWLPASGFRGSALASIPSAIASGDPSIFWNAFRYFILPSISLAFVLVAINARLVRSSMIEVLQQDYITFARAKGLPIRIIYLRHALRNALLPVLTVVGLQLGSLLSGTIVIETVFAWPGIGRLAVQAVHWRDYPLIQAVVLISALLFVSLNLVVDLLYRWVDPRAHHG